MKQQIVVIGLGQFGMSLVKTLSEKGAEVMAVDIKKSLVEEASNYVTEAVIADATDEVSLAKLQPDKRDCAICAIGDDSKEASIICTALLKQMGATKVISRANDKLHQRILQLVGADQVTNPEQEFGRRFANRVLYNDIIKDVNLGNDLHLTEVLLHKSMVGKNLIELELPKRFGIMVVGIRRNEEVMQPNPYMSLKENDNLIIVSNVKDIPKLMKGI
ncbi:MAG: potassium transporter TrkA [Candidatus Cloacimonadota bacterium]|nr:MAG: potassium transporter TrkA [Candidatus Cloacimonadota bacterium]PIE79339.1 MAG: potassium transporter TrkA [Candidatus Delongbacteria bacterium]